MLFLEFICLLIIIVKNKGKITVMKINQAYLVSNQKGFHYFNYNVYVVVIVTVTFTKLIM